MKLGAAVIILLSSVAISFAGDITTVPKTKIVQNSCSNNCAYQFTLCLQVCGSTCLSTANTFSSGRPAVARNCDNEQSLCLLRCAANPRG